MKNIFESALKLPSGPVGNDVDKYLDKVYNLNKEKLDEVSHKQGTGLWGTYIDPKELLKAEVKGAMRHNDDLVIGDAVKSFGRTELFIGREERRVHNAIQAIRARPEVYGTLRKGWGWNRKLDWSQFRPTADSNIYTMGNVVVSFKNSPIAIIISYVDEQGRARSESVSI